MRKPPRPFLLILVAVLVAGVLSFTAVPGAAAPGFGPAALKRAPDFGPAPVRCIPAKPGDGCYGDNRHVMDDAWSGVASATPHLIKLGEKVKLSGTAEKVSILECGYAPSCTITPKSPTNGWPWIHVSLCKGIACGVEQDFYGVLPADTYAIDGTVRDAKGKGVGGLRVMLGAGYYAETNRDGYYQAILPKGNYTVSAGETYCVEGSDPCQPAKAVVLTGTAHVDFREASCGGPGAGALVAATARKHCFRLSGRVVDEAGRPANSVSLRLSGEAGGTTRTGGTAGPGRYLFKELPAGTYVLKVASGYCASPFDEKKGPRGCTERIRFTLGKRCKCDKSIDFEMEAYTVGGRAWGTTPKIGVPNATVRFDGARKDYTTRTKANGEYSLRLRRGAYRVSAPGYCHTARPADPDFKPGDLKQCEKSVKLTFDFPYGTLDWRLEAYRLRVSTVSEKGVVPQAGVQIHVTGPKTDRSALTNEGGFVDELLPPATYAVTASDPKDPDHPQRDICPEVNGSIQKPCIPVARVQVRVEGATGQTFRVVLPELRVEVTRVKNPGDADTSETSGKTFLGHPDINVGFRQPYGRDGFEWLCRSGCFNLKVSVHDARTGKFVPGVKLHVSSVVGGKIVTDDVPFGFFCPADDERDCSREITAKNLQNADYRLYYWLPGVIDDSFAILTITAEAPGYDTATVKPTLKIRPNVAFDREITLGKLDALFGSTVIPAYYAGEWAELSDYCEKIVEWVLGDKPGWTQLVAKGVAKAAKGGCNLAELPDVISNLKQVTGWATWVYFGNRFNFPSAGLVGKPNAFNHILNTIFEFSGFWKGFLGALRDWALAYPTAAEPDRHPIAGDHLRLRIYEVSHKELDFKTRDALYIVLEGSRGGVAIPPAPIGVDAAGGYYPGCWLDPSVNRTWFGNGGSCPTPD